MPRALPLLLCLVIAGCGTQEPPAQTGPTWHGDAQPLLEARCGGCHVEGGIAPFALTTFADAEAHHLAIADAVRTRRMPPWMPSDDCQSFEGSRRMPQDEVDTLVAWAEAGAPEGEARPPPPPAKRPALGWVDLELQAAADYLPPEGVSDDYRCLVVETGLQGARDLVGFEVRPGSTRTVHHVILYAMDTDEARALDDQEAGLGYTCFGGPGGALPRMVGAWAPGSGATVFPRATGVTLYPDDVLVMQIHYNLTAGREADRTTVALQLSEFPRPLHAHMFPMPAKDFVLAPRSTNQSAEFVYEIPLPITLWGVMPHMHLLGRTIRLQVERAAGADACLIDIPAWDFHWQQAYFYSNPKGIPLEAGDTLRLTCTWDNPRDVEVRWGEGTADEMCLLLIYVTGQG